MLENLRGSRNDMDFMVADFENGDNAKDILAQSDKATANGPISRMETK